MNILKKIKDIVLDLFRKVWAKLQLFLSHLVLSGKERIRLILISGILILSSLVLILFFSGVSSHIEKGIPGQNMNETWGGSDYAEVSCFYSKEDGLDISSIKEFEYNLENDLKSYLAEKKTNKKEKESKLWMDSYCGEGSLSVSANGATVTGTAYGVGGDFFAIHNFPLLDGGYLDSSNVMKDYVLLDEDGAWQLFGSSNVSGLSVDINGDTFIVAGVVDRADGYFNNAAGNDKATFYVPYESLQKYDETVTITTYEVIMKNPVKHYAYDYINKKLGNADSEELDIAAKAVNSEDNDSKKAVEVIENSDRYSFGNTFSHLKNTFINTMVTTDVKYPFWENVARGSMSLLTCLFFIRLLFVLIIFVTLLILLFAIKKSMKNIKKQLDNKNINE